MLIVHSYYLFFNPTWDQGLSDRYLIHNFVEMDTSSIVVGGFALQPTELRKTNDLKISYYRKNLNWT